MTNQGPSSQLSDYVIDRAIRLAKSEMENGRYDINRVRGYIQGMMLEQGKSEEEAADIAYDWLDAEQQKQAETDEKESRLAASKRLGYREP